MHIFSNYSAWLNDPVNIKQSSQVVWPIVIKKILNGDVVTFKVFKQHQVGSKCGAEGLQVKLNYIGLQLRMSAIMLFAGWFHYHKSSSLN
jgi:photosystem I P700 chlorophyll a apoprotein A1